MSLPRPGVEVIQQFRTTSPTVITPTLVPNVTGVAKQLVDLNISDGAGGQLLNPDALVQLPGVLRAAAASGSPAVYGGLDGLGLVLSLLGGPVVTVTFVDATASGLTPAAVVAQIQKAFTLAGVTAAYPEIAGTDAFQIRTVGTGGFQSIYVDPTTAPAVAAAFGIGLGRTYTGLSAYNQYGTMVARSSFPDPRDNLDELGVEASSVRAFLALGGTAGVREALRDSTFLRNGYVNDAVVVTGSVSLAGLTYPSGIGTGTLQISVDGAAPQAFAFASPANQAALLSQLNGGTTGFVATAAPSTNYLVLTSDTVGAGASIEIVGGTLVATLGLTVGVYRGQNIAVVDDGDGDTLSPLVKFAGETFTTAANAAVVTASLAPTNPANGTTLILSDGGPAQTVVFNSITGLPNIVTAINAVVGAAAGGFILAADSGGGLLRLTSTKLGTDSFIRILGGTALAALDPGGSPTLVAGTYRAANPNLPVAGDEVWVDGEFLGIIRTVAPGGAVDTLRLDRTLAVNTNLGSSFYVVAKGLPASNRPDPDLIVGADGTVFLKPEQLRDITGAPVTVQAPVYISYSAVRRDVSPAAKEPGLLVFNDTTELQEQLSPVNASNPLALGLFFALINGAGVQVTGLGVDEISADSPYGTVEAYARAAEYLEGKEIYATTPLTHDPSVHQIWKLHAEAMSEPEAKGERVAVVNPEYPTAKLDDLVASSTNGNTSSTTAFATGVANLTALLLNKGINPTGTIATSAGLFLDVATDNKRYSIQSVDGATVHIRTTFAPGENEDGFYSTTALPAPLIQVAFAVRIRGALLYTPTGTLDNNGVAETVAAVGQAYGSRRLWMVLPDKCAATIGGLETLLEGFYTTAGIVGLIGAQPPQQSFTNFPMAGYTRVIGSQDRFNDRQLSVMAGGGAYILLQDAIGAPVIARQALTTDLTSVETRTDSITKVVDFTAKLLRRSLRAFIGRFNVAQGLLDSLGAVINGVGGFLIEAGVLTGFTLNNIIQDEDAPDTVLVDVTLDVPYPCNFLRLTLVV